MTILILHFLRFGALKFLSGAYLVLRIDTIIYSKKMDVFVISVFFPAFFLQHIFTFHFVQGGVQMAYG